MHQLNTHHQVIIEKFSRVFAISADAAHMRRQMNNHIRARVIQHPRNILRFYQIVVLNMRNKISFAPRWRIFSSKSFLKSLHHP
jgi:hypothetical protein